VFDADDAASDPALDAAGVSAALVDALGESLEANPSRLEGVFTELLARGDEECPAAETFSDGAFETVTFEADCVSSSGTRFAGAASYTRFVDAPREDGATETGFTLDSNGGTFEISDEADGSSLVLSGYFDLHRGTGPGFVDANVNLQGTVTVDEAHAERDPWLSGARRGTLSLLFYGEPGAYQLLYLDGAVAGLGGGVSALSVAEAGIEVGSDCDREPRGTLSVRDDNGVWHDVVFDGHDDQGGACDGCGEHLAGGVDDEPVCVGADAFESLFAFETWPW
jgi:hypothetical protein